MKRLLLTASTAALLSSCMNTTPKTLILYYSQTGATEKLATELQKQTGADIERFNVAEVLVELYRESRGIMLSCGNINQWKPHSSFGWRPKTGLSEDSFLSSSDFLSVPKLLLWE